MALKPGERDDEGGNALIGDEEALDEADDDADASISTTTSGQGRPACSEIAASALTSASTEPTERSIPAVVITKVIATATIIKRRDLPQDVEEIGLGQERVGDEREDDRP